MSNYKMLDVWKLSMDLVKEVYMLVKKYPKEEIYALSSQTKRCAVSIPSNIAEGLGRQYKKDTIQFLHIARGSLYELDTQVLIALQIDLIDNNECSNITGLITRVMMLLNGLIRSIENREDLK